MHPVFSSYGSRPLTDRAAIAMALAGAAATALQHGSPQHPGQWSGLSLRVAPTTAWRTAALEVTVTAGYRHSATVEVPKSWLQQGQPWRIVAALQQLVDEAPAKAAELREAAAANCTRATDSQPLLSRPFEHADKLKAALQRQKGARHADAGRGRRHGQGGRTGRPRAACRASRGDRLMGCANQ